MDEPKKPKPEHSKSSFALRSGLSLKGLKPEAKELLHKLANEYKEITGKDLVITSTFRGAEKQATTMFGKFLQERREGVKVKDTMSYYIKQDIVADLQPIFARKDLKDAVELLRKKPISNHQTGYCIDASMSGNSYDAVIKAASNLGLTHANGGVITNEGGVKNHFHIDFSKCGHPEKKPEIKVQIAESEKKSEKPKAEKPKTETVHNDKAHTTKPNTGNLAHKVETILRQNDVLGKDEHVAPMPGSKHFAKLTKDGKPGPDAIASITPDGLWFKDKGGKPHLVKELKEVTEAKPKEPQKTELHTTMQSLKQQLQYDISSSVTNPKLLAKTESGKPGPTLS